MPAADPTFSAVVAGHICLDMIPNLGHLPSGQFTNLILPGHTLLVGPAGFMTGGPVSNTGLALHRLGIGTRLIAKTGADPFGEVIRQIVEAIHPPLVSGLVRDPAVSTSYTVILSPPGLDRIFLHCPGANDSFDAGDIDYDLVRQARLFHFGYPPVMRRMYSQGGHGLVEVFRRAKAAGATTSLDMTSPDPHSEGGQADWISILRRTLPYVDVFLPSFEELLFMLRRELHDELQRSTGGDLLSAATPELVSGLGEQLIDMGVRIAVIKMGSCGLYVRTASAAALRGMGRAAPADPTAWADRELRSACFQVQVVGTTGSGDATIAGFLSAMLRGLDLREAATMAVAVGACNVEAADALSGLCSWEDTLARVQSGWPRHFMDINSPGWTCVGSGLWEKTLPAGHESNA